jgi:hypothetical protein
MSQTKTQLHTLKVRQKPNSGKVSTGANTEVFLDGEPLRGVTFLKFEFKAAKVTKVQMEILAKVEEIEGNFMIGSLYPSNSEPVTETQQSRTDTDRLNFLLIRPGLLSLDLQGRVWVGPQAEPGMGPFKTSREAIDAVMNQEQI